MSHGTYEIGESAEIRVTRQKAMYIIRGKTGSIRLIKSTGLDRSSLLGHTSPDCVF